jgi:hypothetical protein
LEFNFFYILHSTFSILERNSAAFSSGRVSLINIPAPASLPARYFSFRRGSHRRIKFDVKIDKNRISRRPKAARASPSYTETETSNKFIEREKPV